jgi:hypothetical protein
MEKKKFWSPLTGGVLGLIIGVGITLGIVHVFGSALSISSPCPPTLTEKQVSAYMGSFLSTTVPYNNILKGGTVDLQQYNAMTCLLSHNSQLAGFRIYYGTDNTGAAITMLVGVDKKNTDDRTLFYNVGPGLSGPCPPICDTSPY